MLSPNVYGFKLLQSVRSLLRSWLPLIQICLLAYVVAVFCISRSSFLPPHKVKLYIRTKLNLCTTYCRHLGLIASPNKSRQMDCLVRHFVSGHYKSSCNPFIFVFFCVDGFSRPRVAAVTLRFYWPWVDFLVCFQQKRGLYIQWRKTKRRSMT